MTAPGTRPPRRTYRDFVRVEGDADKGEFMICAHPFPLHHATVVKHGNARVGWSWVVRFPTFGGVHPALVFDDMTKALNAASVAIGLRSGKEMMRFDGAQRYAMGQQKCPYREKGHPRLCEGAADPGTVWCGNHRGGKSTW